MKPDIDINPTPNNLTGAARERGQKAADAAKETAQRTTAAAKDAAGAVKEVAKDASDAAKDTFEAISSGSGRGRQPDKGIRQPSRRGNEGCCPARD